MHRPHRPVQGDGAVVRSSPEYSAEGKKGLQKTSPRWLGLIAESQAIRLLLALGLQHTSPPVPQRPPQPGARTSSIGEARKVPPTAQGVRVGRTLQCHVPGDARGGEVLRRALGTKPAVRLHQGGDALPCPAEMEAAGTRPKRGRECLQ